MKLPLGLWVPGCSRASGCHKTRVKSQDFSVGSGKWASYKGSSEVPLYPTF